MDFARFARILGYKNERSAQDSYHRFRARLRGDKNYGNRRGRAHEFYSDRLRDLDGKDGANCHRDVGQDDEDENDDFYIVGDSSPISPPASAPPLHQSSGAIDNSTTTDRRGGIRSATGGNDRRRRGEPEGRQQQQSKGFTIRGTVNVDPEEIAGGEGEGEDEVIEIKDEIKEEPEPEVWSWEGTIGFKGYI